MNKELQDKAWAVLPKEFREEVKEAYKTPYNSIHDEGYNHALEYFFGEHNLTSDTEETANITSKTEPKFKIGDKVKILSDGRTGTITSIEESPSPYFVIWDNTQGFAGGYLAESDIELYTEEKNFFVGDKVLISDDPRIGKDFRGRIGTVRFICSSDKRIVDVGNGVVPECFHISHLAPYIEPKQGSESAQNENNGNHNVGSENKQPAVRIYRPNINLTSPSDNQLRIMVAAEVMKGMLANTNIIMSCGDLEDNQEYINTHAVEYADVLIKEINERRRK